MSSKKIETSRILKMSMTDTVKNSLIALPIISVFEIIMLVRWFIIGNSFVNSPDTHYFIAYVFLLTASLITYLMMILMRKSIDEYYKDIHVMQLIYAVLIVLWSIYITFVSAYFGNYFETLVYITIIVIVPVFTFIKPLHWIPIQFISAVVVSYIAFKHDNFDSFIINFSVFTIISLVASWTLFKVRLRGYIRQAQLEDERDQTRFNAYYDQLTSLPNRRSYIDATDELEKKEKPEDLIIAGFDVNGLKKANDTLGHDAGDELLSGAADCLKKAFGNMGTVYRVGGDEFSGILFGTEEELSSAIEEFNKVMSSWSGNEVKYISIAEGTASTKEFPGLSIKELEVIADDRMYADKKEHYKNTCTCR